MKDLIKDIRMKAFSNLIFFTLVTTILFSCNQNKNQTKDSINKIVIRNILVDQSILVLNPNKGVWNYNNIPFNGYAIVYHKNDTLKQKTGFYNGKKQGVSKEWFPNGQLRIESYYHQNALTNTYKAWRLDGVLESECFYVDGKKEGVEKIWYPNGMLSKERNLTNGKENGLQRAWLKNGKIYVNYEARNGRVFGLKRANLCYKLNDEKVILTKK